MAFSVDVFCDSRHSCIEIAFICGEYFCTFRVHQVAQQIAFIFFSIRKAYSVWLLRCERVNLLNPDTCHLAKRSRISAQMHVVRLVHNTTHKCCDESTAVFHKLLKLFLHAFLYHVQNRCGNHLIFWKITVNRNHIDWDIFVVKILIIVVNLVNIFKVLCRSACVLKCPVIVPVEDDSHIWFITCAKCSCAEAFKLPSKLCSLLKYPCVVCSDMCYYSTVEFLAATLASSELEELDSVCTVGYGLIALCTHLSRTLQWIVVLPVLLAWSLLHEHEWLILKTSHQIVSHRNHAPWCVVCRVIIPRHDIHLLSPLEIVKTLEGTHQVCCDKRIGNDSFYCIALQLIAVQHAVRVKTSVVCWYSGKACHAAPCLLTELVRYDYLIPVIEGVSPELCVPGIIYSINGLVLILEPYTKLLLAVVTVAVSAVLIIDVPYRNIFIAAIAFCKLCRKSLCVLLIYQGVRTEIVSGSKFMLASLVVGAHRLRIFFDHPCRQCRCGCCHDDVVVFIWEHINYLVKLCEIILILRRLYFSPWKNVDCGTVDMGILKVCHVLLPDLLRPLVWIVISSEKDSFEFWLHFLPPLWY